MQTDQVSSTISIQTLDEIRKVLRKTRGWLVFLAVVSFGSTLLSLVSILISVIRGSGSSGVLDILVKLLFAGFNIALAVFLLQASQSGKKYAESGKAEELTAYHDRIKIYFTITGLLVLIGFVVAVLMALIGSGAGLRG
ncbi:hypothetical protein KAX06_07405 [candidate division WOR-3 bacterium]|nr:hypothetical protein [candidate division WOR-3 bacterium]